MTIPTYLPYFVLPSTTAMVIAILYGLNRALADAAWPARDRLRTVLAATVILLGWLALSIALGAAGVYRATSQGIPTLQYGILLPILIGGLLIFRSETAKRILAAVPQAWLVGVQIYRALGVVFLVLYMDGRLPGLFAWPAGVGDIAIGFLAPAVGIAYARAPGRTAAVVRAWNTLGILDLVVAVTTGFLAAPSLFQPFEVQPTSELVTVLPLALVPVFLVPLSILLHIASLVKLHREEAAAPGHGSVVRAAV